MAQVWMTAAEIAALALPELPETRRGLDKLAKREGWTSRRRSGRGGGKEYPLSALPEAAQVAYVRRKDADVDVVAGAAGVTVINRAAGAVKVPSTALEEPVKVVFSALSADVQRTCEARAAVVQEWLSWREEQPHMGENAARRAFQQAWKNGLVSIDADLRACIRGVSPNSVRTWERGLASGGLAALAPKYGNRKGTAKLDTDDEMRGFVLGLLVEKPHLGAQNIMDALEYRFAGRDLPSQRALERWLNKWRAENRQLYTRITNPDAWRSKYMSASGSRSEGIELPNQLWELDSTPADMLLTDGYRHKIVGAIDVASRRLKLWVSRESTAAAVSSVMRKGIMDWGLPKGLRIDNGADYTSKHMTRVYQDLQLEVEVCPPFEADHKPHIERVFRTFSHGLLEMMPGFCGHNVSERKDIEARKSFARRLMDHKEVIEAGISAEELQDYCDKWCTIYEHRPHSSLNGLSPFEWMAKQTAPVARIENERALDILLMPTSGDGWRTVTKKGIRIGGASYIAAELGGLEGCQVKCLYDQMDAGRIYVFDDAGVFVCAAVAPDVAGVSRMELAMARKKHQREVMSEGMKEMRRHAREIDTAQLARDIMESKLEEAGKLARLHQPSESVTTPALEEAAKAHRYGREAPVQQLTPEQEEQRSALVAEFPAIHVPQQPRSPQAEKRARFARAQSIEAAQAAGRIVDDADAAWLERYSASHEYRAMADMAAEFEGFGAVAGGARASGVQAFGDACSA